MIYKLNSHRDTIVEIENTSHRIIRLGNDGVTASDGFPLHPGERRVYEPRNFDIYATAALSGAEVNVYEYSYNESGFNATTVWCLTIS